MIEHSIHSYVLTLERKVIVNGQLRRLSSLGI